MASVNKVTIIGNLTRNPEATNTQGGLKITKFSVATSEKWTDKGTGEKQEKTEFHRVVTFGKLAEICSRYLEKGKQVYIEGRLQTNSWEKDGVKRYSTDIIAHEMKMLGSKGGSAGQPQSFEQLDGNLDSTDIPF